MTEQEKNYCSDRITQTALDRVCTWRDEHPDTNPTDQWINHAADIALESLAQDHEFSDEDMNDLYQWYYDDIHYWLNHTEQNG